MTRHQQRYLPAVPASLALVLLFYASLAHADYERGLFAYNHYDYPVARQQFKLAALNGHSSARFYLGEIHEGGVGVPIDYKKAFTWYRQAAEQEHPVAQLRLARLYQTGRAGSRDAIAAFKWCRQSAENGYPLAQYEVGRMYAQGRGTRVDTVEAWKWLTIAASYGDPDAMAVRTQLVTRMSPGTIATAQLKAREWETAWENRQLIRPVDLD